MFFLFRVGIDIPTIEVRFENLNIEAEVYVGSRALPSFVNFMTNIVEGFLNILHVLPNRKKHLTILQDVSGMIKPNRYEFEKPKKRNLLICTCIVFILFPMS